MAPPFQYIYIYIYIYDIFSFLNEKNLANYADAIESTIESVISVLENDAAILIRWFHNNYLKMNEDKCHLLITNQDEGSIIDHIGDEIIKNSQSKKLLGIILGNEVNFNKHVSILRKKVNLKLSKDCKFYGYK